MKIPMRPAVMWKCAGYLGFSLFLALIIYGVYVSESWEVTRKRNAYEKEYLRRRAETPAAITMMEETISVLGDSEDPVLEKAIAVEFTYHVGGRELNGRNIVFGQTLQTIDVAAPGRPPRACYDPDHPEDARLRASSDKSPCGALPSP